MIERNYNLKWNYGANFRISWCFLYEFTLFLCVWSALAFFTAIVLNWSFEPLTSLETGNGARVLLIYLYLRLYQFIIHLCWKSLNTCLVLVKSTYLIEKIDIISHFLRVQKVSKSTRFWNIFFKNHRSIINAHMIRHTLNLFSIYRV